MSDDSENPHGLTPDLGEDLLRACLEAIADVAARHGKCATCCSQATAANLWHYVVAYGPPELAGAMLRHAQHAQQVVSQEADAALAPPATKH